MYILFVHTANLEFLSSHVPAFFKKKRRFKNRIPVYGAYFAKMGTSSRLIYLYWEMAV